MGRKKGVELATYYVSIPAELKERMEDFCISRGLIKGFILTKIIEDFLAAPEKVLNNLKI